MIRQLRTQLDTERDELKDQVELRMNGFLEGYSKMSIEFEETKKERDDLLQALRAAQDTPSKPSTVGIPKESGEFAPPIGRELFSGIPERGLQSDLREKASFPVPQSLVQNDNPMSAQKALDPPRPSSGDQASPSANVPRSSNDDVISKILGMV